MTGKAAWIVRVGAMQRLAVVIAVGVVAYFAQPMSISWHTRAVVSWDLSVVIYLALAWWLIASSDAATTRDHALSQDQSVYVIFLFVVDAFRAMDPSLEEASRMSGASALGTLFRITVPAMTPVIIVVFLLSVIRIFSSFETELLLGVPWGFYVYATKIVDLARQEPPLINQAAALGSVILIFLVAFIPIQRRLIARRHFTTVTGQFKPKIIELGVWRVPATSSSIWASRGSRGVCARSA